MNVFIAIVVIGLLSFLLWKNSKLNVFWPALVFKFSCGILLGLLYKYYYTTGDTWNFFTEGVSIVRALSENPVGTFDFFWNDELPFDENSAIATQPRSLYFLKWVAVFLFLGGDNYWIASLYFSLISFMGCWYFFRTLIKHFPNLKLEIMISVLFVPSLIFWSSGIIKESLAISSLFILSSVFIDWFFTRRVEWISLLTGIFSFWILWSLKYYWLAVWLGVAAPTILISLLKTKVDWINKNRKSVWLAVLFISFTAISFMRPNFYFDRLFFVIAENHDAYIIYSAPDDVIHYHNLSPSPLRILINSPMALLSGLFRPFLLEAGNILQLAASIENLVLLILFGFSVYRFRIYYPMLDVLHLAILFYTIILAVFLALSTPNFGTLSRYKIAFTPFLWITLLSGSGLLQRFRILKSS